MKSWFVFLILGLICNDRATTPRPSPSWFSASSTSPPPSFCTTTRANRKKSNSRYQARGYKSDSARCATLPHVCPQSRPRYRKPDLRDRVRRPGDTAHQGPYPTQRRLRIQVNQVGGRHLLRWAIVIFVIGLTSFVVPPLTGFWIWCFGLAPALVVIGCGQTYRFVKRL